jgi:hypothetical protein
MSSTNAFNMDTLLSAISAIESQVQNLRSAISSYEAKPTATKKRASAKAAAADGAEPKPKREINPKIAAMNVERKAIFDEMKAAWTASHPSFASLSKDELKKAVAEGKVPKPPSFPEAISEHSRRLRENDPAAEARHQTYLAKRAKKAADAPAPPPPAPTASAETSTVASSDSEGKKKRGPAKGTKLTDEQKAQRKAKRAENAAKKKLDGVPPLPPSPSSD